MNVNDGAVKPTVSGSLARIREITNYQKSLYDDLVRKVQQIDERLADLNPGVEAKIELPILDKDSNSSGPQPASAHTDYLGFHRGPKGWHIHYLRQQDEPKKIVYYQLLTEARREFQIRSVEYLPRLIERLAEETERKTDEIRGSLDLAESIADSLV